MLCCPYCIATPGHRPQSWRLEIWTGDGQRPPYLSKEDPVKTRGKRGLWLKSNVLYFIEIFKLFFIGIPKKIFE